MTRLAPLRPETLRTAWTAALVVLGVAAAGSTAMARAGGADALSIDTFEPQPAQGINLLNLSETRVLPHLRFAAGALFHFCDDPLTIVDEGARDQLVQRVIDHQLTVDVSAALGLFDVASVGVSLPVTVLQAGDDLSYFGRPGQTVDGVALGDVRLTPKLKLLDPADAGGFGVHLTVPIQLPTGDAGSFKTDEAIRISPTLGLDLHTESGVALVLNAGYRVRPRRVAHNYVSDDAFAWAFGFRVPLIEQVRVVGSVFGSLATKDSLDPSDPSKALADPVGNPIEAVGGVEIAVLDGLVMGAGAGGALVHGVGSPDVRAYLHLGWTPLGASDSDSDGIPDPQDRCRDEPEDIDGFEDDDGCPEADNDRDGFPDPVDGCRDEAEDPDGFEDDDGCPDPDNDHDGILDVDDRCRTDAEDIDGFEDADGCPDPDDDGDGLLDGDDRCPRQAEDKDGIADEDGCPEADFDGDGLADEVDECPLRPETANDYQDEDGCPDTTAKDVEVTGTEIRIKRRVYFQHDKGVIKDESYPILNSVAVVLSEQPFITKVRVEGHTDSEGTEEFNLELSQKRADAVRAYLITQGVDASRLVATGFGEGAPIAPNTTPMGRARNRRVDFKIIEIKGEPVRDGAAKAAGDERAP